MTIAFACPTCSKPFRVPDDMAGRRSQCPACRTSLMVPGGNGAIAPQPAMAPAPMAAPMPYAADGSVATPRRRLNLSKKMLVIVGVAVLSFGFLAVAVGGGLWYFVFSASGPGDEIKYLPNNCQLIGAVRVEQLIASDAYKDIKGALPDREKDWEKDFEKEMGVPVSSIQHVMFGGTLGAGAPDFVMVIRTNKDITASDIIANRKNASFKEDKVGNYTVHEGFSDAFCLPEKRIVVLAKSKESLKKILERDKKPELSEGLRNAMKHADFSKTVAIAVNFKDIKNKLEEFVPGGKRTLDDVDLDDIEGVALEAKVGKDIAVTNVALCKDEKSAEDVRKLADGMLVIYKKIKSVPGSKEFREILDTWQASVSKSKVSGTMTVKTELVVKMMKAAQEKSKGTVTTGGPVVQP
ncbi:MAG: zinc-ribbon domain-containing protein [Gemmataceae bacterium]|nr:zinc-ribbon domain-containing protein [Gemmataceae bacterium]